MIRILLLLIGYACLKLSLSIFLKFKFLSFEVILQQLVFQPFKWFGAIMLFMFGFLVIARVIKSVYEQLMIKNKLQHQYVSIVIIGFLFLVIGIESFIVAIIALGLSLFYGIMDAKVPGKKRYYNS